MTVSTPSLLRRVVGGLFVLALASGCGDEGDGDDGTSSSGSTSSDACGGEPGPTWESFGQEFFTNYCTRCHSESLQGTARDGAPYDRNFDTLELVRKNSRAIERAAAATPEQTNTLMPPGDPKPTDAERMTLGTWLACGAP